MTKCTTNAMHTDRCKGLRERSQSIKVVLNLGSIEPELLVKSVTRLRRFGSPTRMSRAISPMIFRFCVKFMCYSALSTQ